MASNAAVPFWRAAGMTYITYSNICANMVRNCLKEPYKSDVLTREKVHFSVSKWVDSKPEKPIRPMFDSNDLLEKLVKLFGKKLKTIKLFGQTLLKTELDSWDHTARMSMTAFVILQFIWLQYLRTEGKLP